MIDPNAVPAAFLHWFQTNLTFPTLSTSKVTIGGLSFHPLLSATPPLAPYQKPQPPAGTGPHRYIELLFSQPEGFSIPANYAEIFAPDAPLSARRGFNITNFARDAGLARPVASNYFFAEFETAVKNETAETGTGSTRR
ncbi:hypothetical protein MMC07_006708 [Pseudocyphellaria aurata]|nr:hypothetical protein [Pseudocyphellaria aurata]